MTQPSAHHELQESRGREPDQDEQEWLRAERDEQEWLRAQQAKQGREIASPHVRLQEVLEDTHGLLKMQGSRTSF